MKTTNKMMKLPVLYYGFLAWIPTSLALAYGSVSFMLLNPNIAAWPFSARFSLLLAWAWLLYVPARVTGEVARFFVLLVLSGVISYVVLSFLLYNAIPLEWASPVRCLSICLASWLAFSLAPFRDDPTATLDRFGRSMMCFVGHAAFFFFLIPSMAE